MNTSTARRFWRKTSLSLVIMLAFSFITLVLPASNASANALTRGPGYWYGNTWTGGYVYNGITVYCDSPFKSPAAPAGSVVTNRLVGGSAAKLDYVLDVYGSKTNPGQPYFRNNIYGAATRLAALTYTGNKRLADTTKLHMPVAVRILLARMLADAEMHYGPYRLVESIKTRPTLGSAGIATFRVISIPTGRELPNQLLSLSAANASLRSSVATTSRTGVATVSFVKTAWADVRISASNMNLLPSTSVRLWQARSAGFQNFVSAAPGVRLFVSAKYHVSPVNAGLAYACTTQCNGVVPVSFTRPVTNVYGGLARLVLIDNGVARRDYLQLAPGARGNKSWIIMDRHTAQIEVQVYLNRKWVVTRLANTIVIDCPPLPQLSSKVVCDCFKGNILFSVPPGAHAQRIIVNGVVTEQPTGQPVSVPITFNRDQAHEFVVQTAVQRTNGEWHSSSVVTFGFAAITN